MERKDFFTKMVVLAEVTNHKLSQSQLEIYFKYLGGYPDDEINKMFESAMVKEKFFPSLAALKEHIDKNDTNAAEVLDKIKTALGKYGMMNPNGARKCMGETAWQAIECMGGWRNYCLSNPSYSEPKLFKYCEMISRGEKSTLKIGFFNGDEEEEL